jgi:Uri superfamily endonuclease
MNVYVASVHAPSGNNERVVPCGGPSRPGRSEHAPIQLREFPARPGEKGGEIPPAGLYVLILRVPSARESRIGAWGTVWARPGYYAYVGRSKRNLPARLRRHLGREGKRRRWHIDHFLDVSEPVEVWILTGSWDECALAERLAVLGGSRDGLQGFGSSDCRCRGHLLRFGPRRPAPSLLVEGIPRPHRGR